PHMQLKKWGRNSETVWSSDKLETLSFKLWRKAAVLRISQPCGRVYDVLDSDQLRTVVADRLIHQRFGCVLINFAVTDQTQVDVMNTHGSVIGTADATEHRPITRRYVVRIVGKGASCVTDNLHQ